MEECYFQQSYKLKGCNFTYSNTPPWVFFTLLNCTNGTESCKTSHILKTNYQVGKAETHFPISTFQKRFTCQNAYLLYQPRVAMLVQVGRKQFSLRVDHPVERNSISHLISIYFDFHYQDPAKRMVENILLWQQRAR